MKQKRLKNVLLSVSVAAGLGLTYGMTTVYGDPEKESESTIQSSAEGATKVESYSSKNCKAPDKYNKSSKCCPKSSTKFKE